MSPEQKKFFKNLMHTTIRAMIYRVSWGIPWQIALVLLGIAIAVVVYFGLY